MRNERNDLMEYSPVEIIEPLREEVLPELENAEKVTRIGRAVLVDQNTSYVDNVIMVALDENDRPIGYLPPEGFRIVPVEDDSPVGPGWIEIDGEYLSPEPVEDPLPFED